MNTANPDETTWELWELLGFPSYSVFLAEADKTIAAIAKAFERHQRSRYVVLILALCLLASAEEYVDCSSGESALEVAINLLTMAASMQKKRTKDTLTCGR